ncbi:hypothetical protein PC129_g25293, partial [Phytophthora cactorum]
STSSPSSLDLIGTRAGREGDAEAGGDGGAAEGGDEGTRGVAWRPECHPSEIRIAPIFSRGMGRPWNQAGYWVRTPNLGQVRHGVARQAEMKGRQEKQGQQSEIPWGRSRQRRAEGDGFF